ncbi:MAG: helix-turn-helix transcriptional regulator [Clostridia bacterium]|nr:helix-turn-helix transcriptional regulator [Clostridia bacterium]MDE7336598.1 helix-turn-helix transcriptional regulator [Clostridia bacterium]
MADNSIRNNIRSFRKSRKLTQEDLGIILGYSARTISDWENGCTEPGIVAIKAMVKFFGITYDEFFEE